MLLIKQMKIQQLKLINKKICKELVVYKLLKIFKIKIKIKK